MYKLYIIISIIIMKNNLLPVCRHLDVCPLSELFFLNLEWTPCLFSFAATLSSTLNFPAAAPFVWCHSCSAESYTSPPHALGGRR